MQILQDKGSVLQQLLSGAVQGAPSALEQLVGQKQQREESQALKRLGYDLEGVQDPNLKKAIIESEQNKAKKAQTQDLEDQRIETVRNIFGDKAADMYRSAPEGGKTEIIKRLLEMKQRGINFEQAFSDQLPADDSNNIRGKSYPDEVIESPEDIAPNVNAPTEEAPGFQFPELPETKGLTPAEIASRQDKRENTNTPIYEKAVEKREAAENFDLRVDKLQELNESGNLPSGVGRFNVDWKTGDILVPAFATPEAQQYTKTIADMLETIKGTFGARITDFDIKQFKQRFPTLANSEEGRRMLLKQLEVVNSLNKLEHESLVETYNHYGIENVNAQQARKYADQFKQDKKDQLIDRFKSINKDIEQEAKEKKAREQPTLQEAEEVARKRGLSI